MWTRAIGTRFFLPVLHLLPVRTRPTSDNRPNTRIFLRSASIPFERKSIFGASSGPGGHREKWGALRRVPATQLQSSAQAHSLFKFSRRPGRATRSLRQAQRKKPGQLVTTPSKRMRPRPTRLTAGISTGSHLHANRFSPYFANLNLICIV